MFLEQALEETLSPLFFLDSRGCLQSLALWPLPLVPDSSDGKASACNVGDLGLIPGLGRYPGEGNGSPL